MTSTVWSLTTTLPTHDDAITLARAVVAARLAAGAEVTGPAETVYWHEGKLGEGQEWRLTCRTSEAARDALAALIAQRHPWGNPEITANPVAWSTEAYADWVTAATAESASTS